MPSDFQPHAAGLFPNALSSSLLASIIEHYAQLCPDRVAVICRDEKRTWLQLCVRMRKVANLLATLDVARGDKIALLMESSVTYYETLFGVWAAGAVAVPFSTILTDDALARLVDNSEAVLLFADDTTRGQIDRIRPQLPNVPPAAFLAFGEATPGWQGAEAQVAAAAGTPPTVDVSMDDTMMIVYSSGSTGVPKGIELTHAARLSYSIGLGARLRFDATSVAVCSTPLYSNGTYMMLLPALYFGATTVLMPRFDAQDFLETVQATGGTHTFMVPVQFRAILDVPGFAGYKSDSLRVLVTAGQPLPGKTREDLGRRFPCADIYEVYGFSEAFGTLNTPQDVRAGKAASVGRPFFFDDVRIIDGEGAELKRGERGEIAVWGPSLMKGYFGDPARTEASTWHSPCGRKFLRSGDIGHLDADGYLYISGRLKETIKSGGINVYAADLEEVFMRHPAVREAVAIGIPDEKWGETPLLLVILAEGAQEAPEALALWGNERLSKYQRVSRVEVRQDFPRGMYGKVLKQDLRKPYWLDT